MELVEPAERSSHISRAGLPHMLPRTLARAGKRGGVLGHWQVGVRVVVLKGLVLDNTSGDIRDIMCSVLQARPVGCCRGAGHGHRCA